MSQTLKKIRAAGGAAIVRALDALPQHLIVAALKRRSLENRFQARGEIEMVGKMDYARHDIFLHVDSLVEHSVRLNSCKKEPDTIEWVESFLRDGDVLFDVGANVGAYSLVASKCHGGKVRVYAFEPAFANYVQLCKNILLNDCQHSVVPLPLALSDRTTVDTFNYRDLIPGSALHTFGEAVGDDGERFQPEFEQHVLSFRLDDLLRQFPVPAPNHLKIDVDGIEAKVLEGAAGTLAAPSMRSIIIELREDRNGQQITDFLARSGFSLHSKHARWTAGLFNYIYSRG
ncbi:MAG: FkbM family methyltransferase [Rubrivivax sp.]|nr:FkbM family methyltransferase [Pyrinomonadaceae bacterium]